MTAYERAPLPPWVLDAVHESCRRFFLGGIPGRHFLIVRQEGRNDEVCTLDRPASSSGLQSYKIVIQTRVIYTLRLMGVENGKARALWQSWLQHLEPPRRDVNHVQWYIEHYYRETTTGSNT